VTRFQLEHIIRAAGAIADTDSIVVVGSQAVLGSLPSAPKELLVSIEADVYPLDHPERADLIDGAIGEDSDFHETFGYFAHGVGPETAILDLNWKDRAVVIHNDNTRWVRGICPSLRDLALSKLCAGRPKDLAFVRVLLDHGLVDRQALRDSLDGLPPDWRTRAAATLETLRYSGKA
jgi:hypothetical protein